MPTFFQEPVLFSMQVLRERLSKFHFFLFSQLFLFFSIIRFCTAWMILIFSPVFGFLFSFSFLKPVGWWRRVRNFWKLLFYIPQFFFFFFLTEPSSVLSVNIYYVMSFRSNCFTCIIHLYLYYTLFVPHTYASYIRHWYIFSHYEIQYKSSSISNKVSEPLL